MSDQTASTPRPDSGKLRVVIGHSADVDAVVSERDLLLAERTAASKGRCILGGGVFIHRVESVTIPGMMTTVFEFETVPRND